MSYIKSTELLQTQDTWKRSQVRLPPSLHDAVLGYANDNDMSLNTAIIDLLDIGLTTKDAESKRNIAELKRLLGVVHENL